MRGIARGDKARVPVWPSVGIAWGRLETEPGVLEEDSRTCRSKGGVNIPGVSVNRNLRDRKVDMCMKWKV